MSRRRGEFEHRTSIFEGAFRAWSHLGGLDPELVTTKAATDLDPLTNPIVNDSRANSSGNSKNPDGSPRREYPYEPLPRSGLAHPYVQAILSPWLGPEADNEAIQLGLTTLRTWWQHRRKGESGSAIAALGTEKMKGVVEGYTRHFFTLAHCIVVNDKVQPPRGLHAKMKELEKKTKKKKGPVQQSLAHINSSLQADLTDPNLTPLEKLHFAQKRQLESAGGVKPINMKNKCVPGKINLPGVVDAVNRQASQMVYRGMNSSAVTSMGTTVESAQYGDPNTTPVVFVSSNGDIQVAMKVDGITCAHCVKIVETVLKGCNGNKSPIDGLLDAAADRDLCSVLIKIDQASNAKRIAFEASRNLSMVGYTAEAKSMNIVDDKARNDLNALTTAFEVVATTNPQDVFDWTLPCTCPDNGILRGDCMRHSQMNTRIFDAFAARERQVSEYMAGCGMKYGMACSCGPTCRCKNCPEHGNSTAKAPPGSDLVVPAPLASAPPDLDDTPLEVDQPMQFSNFGMVPPAATLAQALQPVQTGMMAPPMAGAPPPAAAPVPAFEDTTPLPFAGIARQPQQQHQQPPTLLAYGNTGMRGSVRGMSITSETTFGRALSSLSALSIDWENLDDFDLDVDHSAGINNRRTSIRRSLMSTGSGDGKEHHVSFKVK